MFAAVLIALIVGFSRMYLDVHWATDVVGGWSIGLLIAALAAALYEHMRRVARAASDTAP
jgi:undecaprenyl-diphosphatase